MVADSAEPPVGPVDYKAQVASSAFFRLFDGFCLALCDSKLPSRQLPALRNCNLVYGIARIAEPCAILPKSVIKHTFFFIHAAPSAPDAWSTQDWCHLWVEHLYCIQI